MLGEKKSQTNKINDFLINSRVNDRACRKEFMTLLYNLKNIILLLQEYLCLVHIYRYTYCVLKYF